MAMDSETKKEYAEFLIKGSKELLTILEENSADNVDILEMIYNSVKAGWLKSTQREVYTD